MWKPNKKIWFKIAIAIYFMLYVIVEVCFTLALKIKTRAFRKTRLP